MTTGNPRITTVDPRIFAATTSTAALGVSHVTFTSTGTSGVPFDPSVDWHLSPSFTTEPTVCETLGHVVDDMVLDEDDRLNGRCTQCGCDVDVARMPGGTVAAKVRRLLGDMIDEEANPDRGELFALAAELQAELEAEERALEEARTALRIALVALA